MAWPLFLNTRVIDGLGWENFRGEIEGEKEGSGARRLEDIWEYMNIYSEYSDYMRNDGWLGSFSLTFMTWSVCASFSMCVVCCCPSQSLTPNQMLFFLCFSPSDTNVWCSLLPLGENLLPCFAHLVPCPAQPFVSLQGSAWCPVSSSVLASGMLPWLLACPYPTSHTALISLRGFVTHLSQVVSRGQGTFNFSYSLLKCQAHMFSGIYWVKMSRICSEILQRVRK